MGLLVRRVTVAFFRPWASTSVEVKPKVFCQLHGKGSSFLETLATSEKAAGLSDPFASLLEVESLLRPNYVDVTSIDNFSKPRKIQDTVVARPFPTMAIGVIQFRE